MSEDKETTVTLPAIASKGLTHNGDWTVTTLGVRGTGRTLSIARADAASQFTDFVQSATRSPAFARDDDGSIIVAIPEGFGGCMMYRVTGDEWKLIGSYFDGPTEAIAACHHYTPLTQR